jgi:hypothetical protein
MEERSVVVALIGEESEIERDGEDVGEAVGVAKRGRRQSPVAGSRCRSSGREPRRCVEGDGNSGGGGGSNSAAALEAIFPDRGGGDAVADQHPDGAITAGSTGGSAWTAADELGQGSAESLTGTAVEMAD